MASDHKVYLTPVEGGWGPGLFTTFQADDVLELRRFTALDMLVISLYWWTLLQTALSFLHRRRRKALCSTLGGVWVTIGLSWYGGGNTQQVYALHFSSKLI